MIAVDTNIVVRLIVGDDEDQVRRALALAAEQPFFVSYTVLVETEWVLRSRYGYDRAAIATALTAFSQLIRVHYEDGDDVAWAIGRYAIGGELADYIHIAAARMVGRFASFERKLAARAGADAPANVEVPA